jgi:hypothetical protein
MGEDVVPEVSADLSAIERLVACRNRALYLRTLSHQAHGISRFALVCRAIGFDQMAERAEYEARLLQGGLLA